MARERPLFAFLHIELPHVPWQYFPDLGRYRAEPLGMIGILGDRWGTNQSQIDQERQRFLFQTGAADAALGAIVARLRALGLWDRSLVVVTADHGSAFKPGRGRRTPTSDNFAEIAGVPLFVKWPRQKRGRVENGPASTLDIAPTVLAVARLKADGLAGSDLRRGIPRRTRLTLTPLKGKKVSLSFATFMRQRAALAHAWRRFANGGWERVSTAIAPPALKAAAAAGQARRADALGLRILSLRWRRIGRTPPSPPDGRELRRAHPARRTGAAVVLNVEVENGPARLRWIGVVAGNRLIGAAPVYEWLGRRFASITSFGAPVSTRQLRNLSFVVR